MPVKKQVMHMQGRGVHTYSKNRQGGTTPKRVQPVILRVPVPKGGTGAQCAAGRLQEKAEGVLADGTFDELRAPRMTN